MKKPIRALALILIITLMFSSCSKRDTDGTETTVPVQGEEGNYVSSGELGRVRLPVSVEDSLNPFFLKGSRNLSLVPLMFDSLYIIDDKYLPVPSVAIQAQQDGLSIIVNIKDGILFSDGSSLTSADVVYSFYQAKLSPSYKSQLAAFASVQANGEYEVVFTLSAPTLSPLSLLDFPIAKLDTADNSEQVPKGSGRYIYKAAEGVHILEPNPYHREQNDLLRSIRLIAIGETVSPVFSLETGEIDACFDDLSSGSVRRADAAQTSAALNNLVYIGINSNSYVLADRAVRKAVSACIMRSDISTRVYSGNALPTTVPVNPAKTSYSFFTDSTEDGIQALESLGYTQFTSSGVRKGGRGVLSFTLICPSENQFKTELSKSVANSLKQAGIKINIREMPTAQYKEALTAGSYDMYIGEVRLLNNMDLSEFFKPDGALSFGIAADSPVRQAYEDYVNSTISEGVFCQQFVDESPFIPLVFRKGVLYFTRKVEKEVMPIGAGLNAYANIHEWNVDS
ncbi:MAG: hypothetical protein GX264_06370 [Clostridiales bacterium]|jgi:peptide/nickel transport system substrate-binding protein|nr:hypothetical protein [Clostridiales bacterium]